MGLPCALNVKERRLVGRKKGVNSALRLKARNFVGSKKGGLCSTSESEEKGRFFLLS